MLKYLSPLLLSTFALFLCGSTLQSQERPKTVGILTLEPTGITEAEARTLTNRLHTELSKIRQYRVVEMAAVEEIFRE